jgi:hypothetical protein
VVVGRDDADVIRDAADVKVLGGLLLVEEDVVTSAHGLFGAKNREGISFAVAGYLGYKCGSVGVERAHDIVAHFRNDRALFIFLRRDFVGGSVFEMNCDRHS